jgi:hypothetical protein
MMADPPDTKRDFARLAAEYREGVKPSALALLANQLGVSPESLKRLGTGWAAERHAWAFPMRNAVGEVVGVRLRSASANKSAVRGGKEGIFIPADLPEGGRLLITEGPTDCAALLDLGFAAVGRPSCSGGSRHVVELVRRLAPADVVAVADRDWPGQRGADRLATVLVAYCPAVRVIVPPAPFKDARAWKVGGAMVADVVTAIDAAPVRRLAVSAERKGTRPCRASIAMG